MAKDYVKKSDKRASRSHAAGGHNWRWPLAGILVALFVAGVFYLKQQSDKLAAEQGDQGGIIQQTMKQDIPHATPVNNKAATKMANSTEQTTDNASDSASSPPPQPKFDFYTMLPQGQQQTADNTAKPATSSPAVAPARPNVSTPVIAQPAAPAAAQQTSPKTTQINEPAVTVKAKTTPAADNKTLENNAKADTSDLIAMEIEKLNENKTTTTKAVTNSAKNNNHYVVQLGVFKNYKDADQLKAQFTLQGLAVFIKTFKKQNTTLYHVYMGPYTSLASAKKQQHLLAANQIQSKITKE